MPVMSPIIMPRITIFWAMYMNMRRISPLVAPRALSIEAAMHLQEAMMDSAENGHLQGMYSISSVLDTAMMYFNWLELLDTNVAVIVPSDCPRDCLCRICSA